MRLLGPVFMYVLLVKVKHGRLCRVAGGNRLLTEGETTEMCPHLSAKCARVWAYMHGTHPCHHDMILMVTGCRSAALNKFPCIPYLSRGCTAAGDGSGSDSIYGGKFNDEKEGLKPSHDAQGVVAMANSGKNTNACQFYLTLAAAPQCDGKHVVVGRVIEGLHVLEQIGMRHLGGGGSRLHPAS